MQKTIQNNQSLVWVAICFLTFIVSTSASAYIPELSFILKKASQTTGSQIVKIEQEVIFKIGEEEAKVDETWLIEGDRNLKLTANGRNFFKENIKINHLYNGKNKTSLNGKNKNSSTITSDFYQRYLFARAKDSFLNYLKELNILEAVRLSRADGVVTYLIGAPSVQNLNPHIWIGQEDFIVRKIRTPSGSVVELNDIAFYPKDIGIAKSHLVSWPSLNEQINKTSNFKPLQVKVRIKKIDLAFKGDISLFYPQNLQDPTEVTFLNKTPMTELITEFYQRFR